MLNCMLSFKGTNMSPDLMSYLPLTTSYQSLTSLHLTPKLYVHTLFFVVTMPSIEQLVMHRHGCVRWRSLCLHKD